MKMKHSTVTTLEKKTGQTQRKFGKWVKHVFLIIKFNRKFLCGLSDVLPQFVCSMELIGMELLGPLEGYLASSTFNY